MATDVSEIKIREHTWSGGSAEYTASLGSEEDWIMVAMDASDPDRLVIQKGRERSTTEAVVSVSRQQLEAMLKALDSYVAQQQGVST